PERTRIQLLAPVVRGRKGRHEKILVQARKSGYVRVMIDGNLYELSEEIQLDKNLKHNIEIVVDRLVIKEGIQKRLADSIESVLVLSDGLLVVNIPRQDAYTLGQLFYFFEFACGISGYLLGVNPFNQPGVESYKRNMFALLGKPGYEEERENLTQAREHIIR